MALYQVLGLYLIVLSLFILLLSDDDVSLLIDQITFSLSPSREPSVCDPFPEIPFFIQIFGLFPTSQF